MIYEARKKNAGINQKKDCIEVTDAAKYITGVIISVDGGNSIGF